MRSRHPEYNRPSALAAQFLPPLLVLWPLLARDDSGLYLGAACALVVALASLASLAWRLSRERKQRGRLLRPALALLMAVLALLYFHGERELARVHVNALAKVVQFQCGKYGHCPRIIPGWSPGEGAFASSLEEGARVRHRYLYLQHGGEFELRIDLPGNLDEKASGGKDRPLKAIGTLPWR